MKTGCRTKAAALFDRNEDMIKAAIFDVDGTVLDTMRVWREADEAYLAKRGIAFDEDVYNKLHTMTFETSVPYFCRAFSLADPPEKVREDIIDEILKRYSEDVEPVAGVPELIKELHARGVKLAVATSNRREFVTAAFERLNLIKYFQRILICDELGTGKHEPVIFELAAKLLGAAPNETAVFEDSGHAIETAKKAGFMTVRVPDHDFSDAAVRKELINSL